MRYVGWLLAGFVFYKLSGALEVMGDAAPYAAEGVSGDRLKYHGAALALLLAGIACFVRAMILAWRAIRGGGKPGAGKAPPKAAASVEAEPDFDPDAALARYLERKGEQSSPDARPGGFGRKGL